MERMGATASREAIMMPISQMLAVSRRAQVGSPLALPCPNTCSNMKGLNELTFYSTFVDRIQIKWCDNHVLFCSLRQKIHMLSQRFWSCWYVLSLFILICILVRHVYSLLEMGWCRPERWPAVDVAPRSDSGDRLRTWKRKSQSQWPTEKATPESQSPGYR